MKQTLRCTALAACLVGGLVTAAARIGSAEDTPAKASNGKAESAGRTIVVPGTVRGLVEAQLVSRLEGYVGKVHCDIGDEVQKGQILAELDLPELVAEVQQMRQGVAKAAADLASRQAEVEQAKARRAQSEALKALRKSEMDRTADLVTRGALKPQMLDEARYTYQSAAAAAVQVEADVKTALAHTTSAAADLEVAKSELKKTEAMAGYIHLKAPFSGLITMRSVDPGAFVQPGGSAGGKPLFEMAQTDRMRVVVHVSTRDAAHLEPGDKVVIHDLQSQPDARVEAAITRTSRAFQTGSRMMQAEIELDNPVGPNGGERLLRAGDYGKVTIQCGG